MQDSRRYHKYEKYKQESYECLELAKKLSGNPEFLNSIVSGIEFVDYDEWGMAIEYLCVDIHEYDVQIPPDFFNKLATLCSSMKLDARYIDNIRHLVKED